MRILAKFNVILIVIFATAVTITGYIAHGFLERDARQQVIQQAELMVGAASGMRTYTADQLDPLLEASEQHAKRFHPPDHPLLQRHGGFQLPAEDVPGLHLQRSSPQSRPIPVTARQTGRRTLSRASGTIPTRRRLSGSATRPKVNLCFWLTRSRLTRVAYRATASPARRLDPCWRNTAGITASTGKWTTSSERKS